MTTNITINKVTYTQIAVLGTANYVTAEKSTEYKFVYSATVPGIGADSHYHLDIGTNDPLNLAAHSTENVYALLINTVDTTAQLTVSEFT